MKIQSFGVYEIPQATLPGITGGKQKCVKTDPGNTGRTGNGSSYTYSSDETEYNNGVDCGTTYYGVACSDSCAPKA